MDPEADLRRWQAVEAAATQDSALVLGPAALVVVPLVAALAAAGAAVRRLLRRR